MSGFGSGPIVPNIRGRVSNKLCDAESLSNGLVGLCGGCHAAFPKESYNYLVALRKVLWMDIFPSLRTHFS